MSDWWVFLLAWLGLAFVVAFVVAAEIRKLSGAVNRQLEEVEGQLRDIEERLENIEGRLDELEDPAVDIDDDSPLPGQFGEGE